MDKQTWRASSSLPLATRYFEDSWRSKTTNRKRNMRNVNPPLGAFTTINDVIARDERRELTVGNYIGIRNI